MGTCTTLERKEIVSKHVSNSHIGLKLKKKESFEEEDLKKIIFDCFDKYDKNHDGFLDFYEAEELVKATYASSKDSRSKDFIRRSTNKLIGVTSAKEEGRISREDFYRFYKSR